MSRHRAPAPAGPASPRYRAGSAVRHGLAAAAVAGGTLAIGAPLAPPLLTGMPARDSAALDLASDSRPAARPPDTTAVTPPTAGPDLVKRRLAAVVPVVTTPEPEPVEFSVAGLLKSVGMAAERERTACDTDLDGLGRVKPWVRDAAQFLACLYDRPDLIGVAGRARHSDHPAGLAVDFMMRGERGDRLAACALANMRALGISYVIWEQRINYGDGWERMEDRGGDTENHVDHVHVSFERTPGFGEPLASRCR